MSADIPFCFEKDRALRLQEDVREGRPIEVADPNDALVLAGVLLDYVGHYAVDRIAEEEGEVDRRAMGKIHLDDVYFLIGFPARAAAEYASVLARLLRRGEYDRACGPEVTIHIDGQKRIRAATGFHGGPPMFVQPTDELESDADRVGREKADRRSRN